MSKLFGTDGVRGVANEKLTVELATKLSQAAAVVLGHEDAGDHRPRLSWRAIPGFRRNSSMRPLRQDWLHPASMFMMPECSRHLRRHFWSTISKRILVS